MTKPPIEPGRLADATVSRLLSRSAEIDVDGPTLLQLREAAVEAGISAAAFDAAVAEWRADHVSPASADAGTSWLDRMGRTALALSSGWLMAAGFAAGERIADAPWLLHKLSDPIAFALGAVWAVRLRARTAMIVWGGLAISQGTEFLMDALSGAPAVQGLGAHVALMVAGVAGVAAAHWAWRRRDRADGKTVATGPESATSPSVTEPPVSRAVGLTNVEAAGRLRWLAALAFYAAPAA